MTSSAQILFTIKIKHEYFGENNAAKDIHFDLEPHSAVLLRVLGDEVVVYAKAKPALTFPQGLIFYIRFLDPLFLNYSDIKLDQGTKASPQILFFNTAQADAAGMLLSQDAPLLPISPLQFYYPLKNNEWQALQKVSCGPIGGTSTPLPLPQTPLKEGYFFDLPAAGGYEAHFEFSGLPAQSYSFFASDLHWQQPPSAVLQWQGAPSEAPAPVYTLHFNARATYWRYFFTGLSPDEWAKTSISPLDIKSQKIQFVKETEPLSLPNGVQAFVAHSDEMIPLMKNPPWKIVMSNAFSQEGFRLPCAQAGILKTIEEPLVSKSGFCSEIFINH